MKQYILILHVDPQISQSSNKCRRHLLSGAVHCIWILKGSHAACDNSLWRIKAMQCQRAQCVRALAQLCKLDCLLVHTCVGISLLKRTYSHSFPHCHKTLRKGFRPEQPSVWMLYRLNLGAILVFFSYISWGGPFCLPLSSLVSFFCPFQRCLKYLQDLTYDVILTCCYDYQSGYMYCVGTTPELLIYVYCV